MKQITINPNNEPYYSEDFIKGFKCGAERQFEADMADRIKEAPSIDIVRCAECMWRDKDNQGEYYCMYVKGMADINDDSFCSWGEREGE